MQRSVQSWKDYQLTWNESDYGGVSSIVVPASSIWTPDILLYNRCVRLFTRPILFLHWTSDRPLVPVILGQTDPVGAETPFYRFSLVPAAPQP